MMKNKDTSFITTTLRGKDSVSGKTIVSGTLATMRGLFDILFSVVKVSAKKRSRPLLLVDEAVTESCCHSLYILDQDHRFFRSDVLIL